MDRLGSSHSQMEFGPNKATSWKEPEPFPRFNAELMRQAADVGALRLGVLRHEGQAIAVQLWVVHDGEAAVLKLAHDEAFKPISPGR